MGIDPPYYEAATVDGATGWQRIRKYYLASAITSDYGLDHILAVGNIFRADFGCLFYTVTRNGGGIYSVTNVLDAAYVHGLFRTGDITRSQLQD